MRAAARSSVPKQRNTKKENEAIKVGKTLEGWEQQPAKNAQKDKDARWTKRNDESLYGYNNHVGVEGVTGIGVVKTGEN